MDKATATKRFYAAHEEGQLLIPTHCRCGQAMLIEQRAFLDLELLAYTFALRGWSYQPGYLPQFHMSVIYPVCPRCAEKAGGDGDAGEYEETDDDQ